MNPTPNPAPLSAHARATADEALRIIRAQHSSVLADFLARIYRDGPEQVDQLRHTVAEQAERITEPESQVEDLLYWRQHHELVTHATFVAGMEAMERLESRAVGGRLDRVA